MRHRPPPSNFDDQPDDECSDTENIENTEVTDLTEVTDHTVSSTEGLCEPLGPSVSHYVPSTDLEAMIDATMPTASGHVETRLFEFLRRLKSVPALADVHVSMLTPFIQLWHRRAVDDVPTLFLDEVRALAAERWPKVLHPFGSGPLDEAVALARTQTVPRCALKYDTEAVRLLVKVCRELQRRSASEPFYLAVRAAAEFMGIDKSSAARFLKMLVADGVLEEVQKGGRPPGEKPRASTFIYHGDDARF